jgi:hypothetical protein
MTPGLPMYTRNFICHMTSMVRHPKRSDRRSAELPMYLFYVTSWNILNIYAKAETCGWTGTS